jgi:hypothetical protein
VVVGARTSDPDVIGHLVGADHSIRSLAQSRSPAEIPIIEVEVSQP